MQLAQWLICVLTVSQAQTIIHEKHKEESTQMSHACVLFWTHAWDQNLKNLKNSSAVSDQSYLFGMREQKH